jgi:hypothetical protein
MLGTILTSLAAFAVSTNGHRLLARLGPKPPEPTPETLAAIADYERWCAAQEEQAAANLRYRRELWLHEQSPAGQAAAVRREQARLAERARLQAASEQAALTYDTRAAAFAADTARYDHAAQLSFELS